MKKPTILIVDDIPSARRVVRRLLERMGYEEIYEAKDGKEAFERVQMGGVGLIISDWSMPVMEGIELLREIRRDAASKNTKFIMITSSADREQVRVAAESGVSDYIVKPFSGETLQQKVDGVLGRSQ